MFRVLFSLLVLTLSISALDCVNLNEMLELYTPPSGVLLESVAIHFLYFNIGKSMFLIFLFATYIVYILSIGYLKEPIPGRLLFSGVILSFFVGFAIGLTGINPIYGNSDPTEDFFNKWDNKLNKKVCRDYDFF